MGTLEEDARLFLRIRVEDLYEDAVSVRADCDEDTLSYRLLDEVVSKLSEVLRIARDSG